MYTTDNEWESLGKENPYFGVLTEERYKGKFLSKDLKHVFFSTGEEYAAEVFSIIESVTGKKFIPQKALDFGCGVGRLTIPIAKRCGHVTGVDVSASILKEAGKNALENGVTNADFKRYADGFLTHQKFDFINTYIVLQHIPVKHGTKIIQALLDALATGGIAVIHVTYSNTDTKGMGFRKRLNYWRGVSPLFNSFTKLLRKAVKGIPLSNPIIQMNYYDLNVIYKMIYDTNAAVIHHEFTNHAEVIGSMLFVRKGTDPQIFTI